jgi:hypothetical protein
MLACPRGLFRHIRQVRLISGEDWFRFVEQPISKYLSISVKVLILRRRHERFFSFLQKLRFLFPV